MKLKTLKKEIDELDMKIRNKIIDLHHESGSHVQVCALLETNNGHISMYLSGKRNVSVKKQLEWAEKLGVK